MTLVADGLFLYWCILCGGSLMTIFDRLRRRGRVDDWWSCRCDSCGAPVAFWDSSLPLLNFVWLRGRSRCCRHPLAVRYPLCEVTIGILLFVIWEAVAVRSISP
jgi:prepilin signal peptidase PulO-like enzyme (type II secretory pathway)